MTKGRLLAAAAGAVLAVACTPAAASGTAVTSAARGATAVTSAARGGTVAGTGTTGTCPRAKLRSPVRRPPRPAPPAADPRQRAVGGDALATVGLVVPPGAPRPPALTATSWVVADLDTGAVVGACGPHEYGAPASVQKLLLAATVMPRLDPDRVVKVTREDLDFEPGSSAVGLLAGGRYTVRILWLGLLLNSGNDAANVLARLGGGGAGVAGALKAMNAEARRLGALQTHAVTPSGLDGRGQFTSAYDLALIARACFARADFRRYVRTERAQMPAQPPRHKKGFQIQNDNQLLFRYRGALGGKTGFTDLARHTYVGAAERDGRRLVVTLLGAETVPGPGWQQGAALLDWGFKLPRDAAVGRLVEPGELAAAPQATATPAPAPRPVARGAAPVARTTTGQVTGWGSRVVAGLAVALATVPLVLLLTTRRRRHRSVRRRAE